MTNRIKSNKQQRRETPILPTTKNLSIKEIVSNLKNEKEETKEESLDDPTDSFATKALKETLNTYLDRGIDHIKQFYYTHVLGVEFDACGEEKIEKMVYKYLEGLQ